jgi:hypothetical protein
MELMSVQYKLFLAVLICFLLSTFVSAECVEVENLEFPADAYIYCEGESIDEFFLEEFPVEQRNLLGEPEPPRSDSDLPVEQFQDAPVQQDAVTAQETNEEQSNLPDSETTDQIEAEQQSFTVFIIVGIVIIFFLLAVFSYLKRHKQSEHIRQYIDTCRREGYTDDQIRAVLEGERGFSNKYINKQFKSLDG